MNEAPLPPGFKLIEDEPPLPPGFKLLPDTSSTLGDTVIGEKHSPTLGEHLKAGGKRETVGNSIDTLKHALPGQHIRGLASNVPGYEYAKPVVETLADHLDTGLKTYANYAYGAARGLPIAGAYIDEAAGGLASMLGYDGEKVTETIRALDEASEESHPAANMLGKLVGGFGGGYGVGVNVIAKGAPALTNLGRGLVAGTVLGAAHEFGDADGDIDSRIDAAETGAKLGAAFALGAPALGSIVLPAGRAVKYVIPTKYKKAFADEQIIKALRHDGLTPKQAFSKYNKGQKNRRLHSGSYAESPVSLADLSESMQSLGRTVTMNPGPARKIAGDFLESRAIQQNDRIADTLERGLRQKSKDGYHKSKEAIQREQKELSKPAYDKAYKNAKGVVIDDLLDEWRYRADLASESIRKKMLTAVNDISRARGTNDPAIALKKIDGAKQGLDDAILKARLKKPNLARELTKIKNELLERVDGANPDYKAARGVYKDKAELLDAQAVGRLFTKGDHEMTAKAFKSLSEPEKEMFRKGVLQELKTKMGDKQFTHDRTSLFNTPNSREVLQVVFQGNSKKFKPYQQFIDLIDTERQFVKTRNKIMGGSPTAPRLAEAREYGIDVANNQMNQMRSGQWAQATLGWVAQKVGELYSFGAKDSEEIARIIFSDNPREISRTLLRLHRRYGEEKTRRMVHEVGEKWEALGIAAQFGTKAEAE